LCSTKKNERNSTKTTNRQLVFMSPNNDADSIWILAMPSVGRANAAERYLANGAPFNTSDAVLITHRQTNCCLVCDPKQRDHTDFGVELECYADRTNAFGKLGLVVSEFKGLSTAYTLTKPDGKGRWGGGNIKTDWHSDIMGEEEVGYNGAIDGIEALVLAHAIAGINVESPAYIEGIETAIDGTTNNI